MLVLLKLDRQADKRLGILIRYSGYSNKLWIETVCTVLYLRNTTVTNTFSYTECLDLLPSV